MVEHPSQGGRTWLFRALIALLCGVVLLAVALRTASHGARAASPGGADPMAQPVLGTADRSTVLMGAATSGAPGEAWAYRVLQLDVPPPAVASGDAAFASVSAGNTTPPGQLVFERATDADPNWKIQETPLDEEGKTYRGMEPDRLSARITPHGGGLLLGQDTARPSGHQIVVLARDPGGRFRVLPALQAGVLQAAGEGGEPAGETLAEKEGAGAVADAAVENGGHTEGYFGALGRQRDLGVARWDGEHWSRETVELPAGYSGSFQIVAIDGASPRESLAAGQGRIQQRAWDPAVQAHRSESRRIRVEAGLAQLATVCGLGNACTGRVGARSTHRRRSTADSHRKRSVDRRQPAGLWWGAAMVSISRSITTSLKKR